MAVLSGTCYYNVNLLNHVLHHTDSQHGNSPEFKWKKLYTLNQKLNILVIFLLKPDPPKTIYQISFDLTEYHKSDLQLCNF